MTSVRAVPSRFVGRREELAALEFAVAEAAAGRPSAVLVSGEAGVGKSRLIGEVAAAQQNGPAEVLIGNCVEVAEGELPYAPVVGALRALTAGLEPGALDELIGRARPVLERLLPDLAHHGSDSPAGGEIDQARLFELLLGVFGRASVDRPLVLVIEDMQWADPSTRDFVSFLIRSMTSERLALIGTYRSDDLHRRHPLRRLLSELDRNPRVARVTVDPFSRAEFTEHVASLTGGLPEANVFEDLYERSEGNAFLTEELLATSSGPGDVPDSIRDAMLVRLERLSPLAQQIVRVAGAAGRRVDHRLLAAVAGVDEATLLAALREAVSAQILVPDASNRGYEFRHALLRETAYEDLLPGEREALHVSLAEALEAQPDLAGHGTLRGELAYHWSAAYEFERALSSSVDAGREATLVAAYAEAQRHFERALELVGRVAPEVRRDIDEIELLRLAGEAARRVGAFDRAASLMRRALEHPEAGDDPRRSGVVLTNLSDVLLEAGATADALDTCGRAIAALPDDDVDRAQALATQARIFMLCDRFEEASASAEQAIAIARTVGAHKVEAGALASLVAASCEVGDFETATARGKEARAVGAGTDAVPETTRAFVNASEALDQAGRVEEAVDLGLEGIEYARDVGLLRVRGVFLMADVAGRLHKLGRVREAGEVTDQALALAPGGISRRFLHEVLALLALDRGDADAARGHQSQATARDMPGSQWIAPATAIAARLLLLEREPARALRVVEDGLTQLGEYEALFYTAPLRALGARAAADAAEAARDLRDEDAADAALGAGRALGVTLDERVDALDRAPAPEIEAHRAQLHAELTRAAGTPDPEAWAAAKKRWSDLRMTPGVAYCGWRQAEALVKSGERTAAEVPAAEARAAAVSSDMRPLVAEIDALARQARLHLAGAEDRGSAASAEASGAERLGLTAREIDVLRLVVEGATNRQIGERLFISEKTASVHVSRILAKLEAGNRGEAAAIARRLGL